MTPRFFLSTKAESLKVHRTNALWLTLAGAAFIPLVNYIKLVGRPDVFVPIMKERPWMAFINDSWAPAASFLLPVYLILVISLVTQIEYGNNTWKQVYATPRTYADIFFSKFLVVNFLIVLCIIVFTVLTVLSAYAVSTLNSNYAFLSHPVPWGHLLGVAEKMYVAILGIVAIQYTLSLNIKNFITPMAIGMALLIGGFMIRQWEYIAYYPYMHTILVYFKNPGLSGGPGDKAMIISPIACVLALGTGFAWMHLKREKG
jgi:lantibiotic transport system permease protein